MLDEYTKYEKGTADGRLSNDGYVASYKLEGFKNLYYVAKSYHFSQGITSNVFTDTRHFSFIWPRRAVFSFGGTTWNFSINRDVLSLGNARFGNMLVDDHTFSDYAKLSFFGRNFKYDLVFMFMNSIVESGETTPNEEARIYMIHTLQFRISTLLFLLDLRHTASLHWIRPGLHMRTIAKVVPMDWLSVLVTRTVFLDEWSRLIASTQRHRPCCIEGMMWISFV